MSLSRTFVLACAVAAVFSAGARAADMPELPPLQIDKTPVVEEFVSGWYLRGDLGYRFQRFQKASTAIGPDPTNNKFDNAAIGGVGAGYKEKWLRADITADYGWRGNYSGTVPGGLGYHSKFDAYTVLGNVYFDLGTWAGITPYIGAGAGGAYLTMSSFTTAPVSVPAIQPNSRWNFAWAVMAGASYHLNYNWLVDVGYRHVDLGNAVGGPPANRLTLKNISGDEIRVGLRYILD